MTIAVAISPYRATLAHLIDSSYPRQARLELLITPDCRGHSVTDATAPGLRAEDSMNSMFSAACAVRFALHEEARERILTFRIVEGQRGWQRLPTPRSSHSPAQSPTSGESVSEFRTGRRPGESRLRQVAAQHRRLRPGQLPGSFRDDLPVSRKLVDEHHQINCWPSADRQDDARPPAIDK